MTKLFPVALAAALALVAGAASADNTFTLDRAPTMTKGASIALSDVQAEQAGSVLVYEHDGERPGNLGDFLGSAPIEAGSTATLAIPLAQAAEGRVTVILMNDNHSVAKMTTRVALPS